MSQFNLKLGDDVSKFQWEDYDAAKKDMEQWERFETTLKTIAIKKNIIKESEFEKYKPLYQARQFNIYDPNHKEELAYLNELSKEFFSRINPYEELIVVSDNDPNDVVAVFPKIYMKFNTLREGVDNAITNFDNKLSIPMRKDIHKEATIELMAALASSQDLIKDPSIRKKEMLKYQQIENVLLNKNNKNNVEKKQEDSKETVSSIEWEFDDE